MMPERVRIAKQHEKRLANLSKGLCKCGQPLETKTKCGICRKRSQKCDRKARERRKREAIDHYGGKCAFCGEHRLLFLTIDHVQDDGATHRRECGISTGNQTYRWLAKNGYPQGFQAACFNCNAAKAAIGAEALIEYLHNGE